MSSSKSPYELKDLKNSSTEIHATEQDNEIEYFETGSNDRPSSQPHLGYEQHNTSAVRRFFDSFKRADQGPQDEVEATQMNDLTSAISPSSRQAQELEKNESSDNIGANTGHKSDSLKKTIQPRHVLMIALGTGIGTGLLVGSGTALVHAGPAGLLIGYAIMGSILYCIIQACGEMALVYSNLTGGYNAYPSFLVDDGFGFAVAWVYCLQWLCVCPLELVTASMTIKYWTTSVNPDVFVIIFYVLVITINIFGARGYAEAEFFFNCCKILMMTGFFILGIIIDVGGAGNDGFIGGKYWHDPGAFNGKHAIDRFKGVAATLVTAAFAFGGSEFIAITTAEQSNPRKAIPGAAKQMIYRILFLFLATIILLGFLVPYNSDQLLGSTGGGTKASPYVIAVASHGVRVVPHFINAVILLSVLSMANSSFYSSARLFLTLSEQGYAPKVFSYIDRAGRPLIAMGVSALFAVIAFCAASPKEEQVFTWLLAISGLSQLFTWTAICLSHLRFRRAMKVQGRSLGELGFKSQTGVWGSAYACIMMILILIAQFWVAIAPIGEGKLDAQAFFENYLAMPILIALYVGYKVWHKDWKLFIRADKIDLNSHRQIFDEELIKQEDEEYRERLRNGPYWKRVVAFWC
ncbi:AIS_HP2_G0005100.mRNA.1.CDS.1 [Saccharomyces cerevisiae]|nr:AIS_HP2_G0005100.mRNA.1.CDS.1 [Saccharomyces cerevisiae]CAI6407600.1 AIS_HP2_G0005100.mRNA.1.CDS.1 [Saccharomyces cerevisiae]